MVSPVSPQSPRIAALSETLSRGDPTALDAFWAQVADRGAPLIEAVVDDPKHALVTFVWRAQGETRSVAALGGMGLDPSQNQLSRLGESDLWYRTYRMPKNLRTQYLFLPNVPAIPSHRSVFQDEKVLLALFSLAQPDPLNPTRIAMPTIGSQTLSIEYSVLELPDAPPQPFVKKRPKVPQGNLTTHTFASRILGNQRNVWVYTPPSYSSDGAPCALLLVYDGEAYTQVVPTATILDNLLAEDRIPPMIAVMPSMVDELTRMRELACCAPHSDHLVRELLPFVFEHYPATRDPALTFIAGSSLGGMAAAYTAFRYPRVFGNVLSQSGSYWWKPDGDEEQEWLAKQFAAARRKPIRFYMDVGLLETSTDHCPVSQLISNRHIRDVLRAKGYPVRYVEYSGGHDYAVWRGTLADGLLALLEMHKAA